MKKLFTYTRMYPAKFTGYISALIIWLHKYLPVYAAELLVPSIIFVIGFAEWAQTVEDKKTVKALYADPNPNIPDNEEVRKL